MADVNEVTQRVDENSEAISLSDQGSGINRREKDLSSGTRRDWSLGGEVVSGGVQGTCSGGVQGCGSCGEAEKQILVWQRQISMVMERYPYFQVCKS